MLTPFVVMLGAAACILIALALVVLAHGRNKAESDALRAHLQRTLAKQTTQGAQPAGEVSPLDLPVQKKQPFKGGHFAWVQFWSLRLGMSAWGIQPRVAWILVLAGCLIFTLISVQAGIALAMMALVVFVLMAVFFFWKKREKQRQRMLEQLPGFLDNMVRLITIGTSSQAAFQMAASNAAEPLRGALQQAAAVLAVSSNLGYAMEQNEETWGLPEFGLLAAVFRMNAQYGGRTDLVLERVATYIRDKHAADRELHAMSAEVRLSAWVLSLLPVVVGALIMVINEGYFMRMWNDESGRRLIFLALGLELVGVALLYRLAKLR